MGTISSTVERVVDAARERGVRLGSVRVRVFRPFPAEALARLVRDVSRRDVEIRVAQPGLGVEYSGDNGRLRRALPDLELTPVGRAVETLYRWYEARRDAIDPALLLRDK